MEHLQLRMKQNVAGEFTCLIIDVNRETDDEDYQVIHRNMSSRRTPSGMLVVTIQHEPEALAGLFYDLCTWGDTFDFGGDPEINFRCRPFMRMAGQVYDRMVELGLECDCPQPYPRKEHEPTTDRWMSHCGRCHKPIRED